MTSALQELFLNLIPSQCLGGLWGHRDRPGHSHLCPSVRATVTQFNKVAGAVVSSVLGATPTGEGPREVTVRPLRPPQRARLLEKWIRVAEVRGNSPAAWGLFCGGERDPRALTLRARVLTGMPPA